MLSSWVSMKTNAAVKMDIDDVVRDYIDHEHDEEEENVIIARIDFDENGEPVYLGPTDEEFEAVKAEYEKIAESWDEE